MVKAVRDYVTGIVGLWAVVDAWTSWECLCGSPVCEWCSNPPAAPVWLYGARGGAEWDDASMITRYDIPRGSLVTDM